ncbi:hypothetical protein A3758_32635, partial [Oleiphilus sp. HI0118]
MTTLLWFFSILGALICIALSIKIARQVRFLDAHKEAVIEARSKAKINQDKLRESIRILCSSMLDEQVEISEGCMRVKILLDHLDARLHHDEVLGVFNEVYERLESMPRFEKRKAVNRKILDKLDETRFAVENDYRERVLVACNTLMAEMPLP